MNIHITITITMTSIFQFSGLMQTTDAKQIREYINQLWSPFQCDYRKRFSTQTTLVWQIEKWKHQLDYNDFTGVIPIDLSKVLIL